MQTQYKYQKKILDLTTINTTNLIYKITFIIPSSHNQQLYTIEYQKTTTIKNITLYSKYWIDLTSNSNSTLLFTLTKLPNNTINITAINIITNII